MQELSKPLREVMAQSAQNNRYAKNIFGHAVKKLRELFLKRPEFDYIIKDEDVNSEGFKHTFKVTEMGTKGATVFCITVQGAGKIDIDFWDVDGHAIGDFVLYDQNRQDTEAAVANIMSMMAILDEERFGAIYNLLSDGSINSVKLEERHAEP